MNPWVRNGLFYEAKLEVNVVGRRSTRRGIVTLSLDLITYHLIRLIRGERELSAMVDRAMDNYCREPHGQE